MRTDLVQYSSLEEHVVALVAEKNTELDNALLRSKINDIILATPKVGSMSPQVIAKAILKAMIPDPKLQDHMDIYMVPYNNDIDVSFSHNYLQKLAYRNGAVKIINTYLIYENDLVRFTQDGLDYEVFPFKDQGDFVGVLVDIKLASGEHKYGTVTKEHIDQARKASRSGNNGPWKTWYYEMAKKVALKNTLKGIDISKEFSAAIAIDNEDTDFSKYTKAKETPKGANDLETMMIESSTNINTAEEYLESVNIQFEVKGDWVMIDTINSDESGIAKVSKMTKLHEKSDRPGMLFGKLSDITREVT